VQTASDEFCRANKELPVTSQPPDGHIASVVTSDRPLCNGSQHPWVIAGAQGQRVNLTLYDFTIDQRLGVKFAVLAVADLKQFVSQIFSTHVKNTGSVFIRGTGCVEHSVIVA